MTVTLPTFVVIGAARSGTTSLYEYVRQHPQVYVSPVKEPNFFAVEGESVAHAGPGEERLRWVTRLEDYSSLFRGAASENAVGEASPLYLYSDKAPERMRSHVPHVRLIAILRNPVERAYSAFSYLRERGSEPLASFVEALEAEDDRVARNWSHIWHYRRMGLYHEQLRRYYDRFDAGQICVFLYEDLEARPGEVMRSLFEHIGVDPEFKPNVRVRTNVSGEARYRVLAPLLRSNRVTEAVRPAAARALGSLGPRIKQRILEKPQIPTEAAERLREAYRGDLERLAPLIGRDLGSWIE